MGTRGLTGFRRNGVDKLHYQQYDSYPDGVGLDILYELKRTDVSIDEIRDIFDSIIMVNLNEKPTKEQQDECSEYTDFGVSENSKDDWYCLLRKAQGSIAPYLNEGLKYMLDSCDFIKDSLYCAWAYIVNLDTEELEVWKGFQREPDSTNRYGEREERDYYPCKKLVTFDLHSLPDDETFINTINELIK